MPYLCSRLANTSRDMSVPDEVDEWTGYRYYSIDQMQQLKDIRDLQRLGFSLDEIKDLFDDGSHTPTIRQMTEKIRETEAQLKELIARRNQLLGWRNARKEMKTMEKFSFQSLPEIIVASHREVIPNYAAIGPMCVEKIGPETAFGMQVSTAGLLLHHRAQQRVHADGHRHRVLRTSGGNGRRQRYHPVQTSARRAKGTLHEAHWPLRALLRVVHRSLPLHRGARPEARRSTSYMLHRRSLESGRP